MGNCAPLLRSCLFLAVFSHVPPNAVLADADSLEVARQLTLIEEEIWSQLQPWSLSLCHLTFLMFLVHLLIRELLNVAWTKEATKNTQSPNVVRLTQRFNEVDSPSYRCCISYDNSRRLFLLGSRVD